MKEQILAVITGHGPLLPFAAFLALGASTSLPEITTEINASLLDVPDIGVGDLMGSTLANMLILALLDLAVGNIFGSNAFNMCVVLFMDLTYLEGPVPASVSQTHVLTAQLAVLSLSFGVIGLMSRLDQRSAVTRFGSLLVVGCYAAGVWLLSRG